MEQKDLFARQRLITRRKPKAEAMREQVRALIDFYKDRKPRAGGSKVQE